MMHSKSVRHPKSEIRKRRLPDRDQIEYFRLGYTAIFNVAEFSNQFMNFWHDLPAEFRDDDDDDGSNTNSRRSFQYEQHYALNEDEFKHNIHCVPNNDDLNTDDLIVKLPHCLIKDKINCAVKHYKNTQKNKIKQDIDIDNDIVSNIDNLSIHNTPKPKRRKLNDIINIDDDMNDNNNNNHSNSINIDLISDNDNNDSDSEFEMNDNQMFGIKQENRLNNDDKPKPKPKPTPTRRRSSRSCVINRRKKKINYRDDTPDVLLNKQKKISQPPPLIPTQQAFKHKPFPLMNLNPNITTPATSNTNPRQMLIFGSTSNPNRQTTIHLQSKAQSKSLSGSPANNHINEHNKDKDKQQVPLLRLKRGRPKVARQKKKTKTINIDIDVSSNSDDADNLDNNNNNKNRKRKRVKKSKSPSKSAIKSGRNFSRKINERPHVLFAANVEMPYYSQLVVPFSSYQNGRIASKSINSKKEVNSITKLTRNAALQLVSSKKGCKLLRENQCLLNVSIFHSNKSSERYTLSSEFIILSNQYLTDLRDNIYCLMDKTCINSEFGIKNSYFFIEDTFYDDCRHKKYSRLSSPIIEWNKSDNHWKQTGIYKRQNMENTRFSELFIRLGSHYLYVHQGDCQHIIIFNNCRISSKYDCNNCYIYPICIYRQILKRQKCGVCEMYPAKYVTYGDKLTTHNPFFFCKRCYYPFHYDKNKKLLYDDFQVFEYIHD